jgi:hypothetical protein
VGFSTLPYLIRMVGGLSQKEFACVIMKSCFIVHPDQSEQVPGMIERYRAIVTAKGGSISSSGRLGPPSTGLPDPENPQGPLRSDEH